MAVSSSGSSLRGADLRHVDLRDRVLTGADLKGADLRGVDLRGRDLEGATLAEADLRGALLDGARLAGADLQDADLGGASLAGADVTGADLRRSRGHGVVATGLRARNARADGAEWRRARLVGADAEGLSAAGIRLDGADLSGARLVRARLERAVLDDAGLDGADLEGARLTDAALTGARGYPRMRDTHLEGADLRVDALERFLGEGVRLAGARIRVAEAVRLQARLPATGWRPGAVDRLAMRALRSEEARWPWRRAEGDARQADAEAAIAHASEEKRAAREQEAAGEAKRAAEAARREEAARKRQEVEARARAELRAAAVRRAQATRRATESGARRAWAWVAQLGERTEGWKEAILGGDDEGAEGGPEGGLDFPVIAERRDHQWSEDRSRLDDRLRTMARAARVEASLRARFDAERQAREAQEAREREEARARWEAEAAARRAAEEEEALRREEARREEEAREQEEAVRREEARREEEAREEARRVEEARREEEAREEARAEAPRVEEAPKPRVPVPPRPDEATERQRAMEAEEVRRAGEAWARAEAERERRQAAERERAHREEERRERERAAEARAYAEQRRREEQEAERARQEEEARVEREAARARKLEQARREAEEARRVREDAARERARAEAEREAERRAQDEARRARDEEVRRVRSEEARRRSAARAERRAARVAAAREQGRILWRRYAPPLVRAGEAAWRVSGVAARGLRMVGGRLWWLVSTPVRPTDAALESERREFAREAAERETAALAERTSRDAAARSLVLRVRREEARAEAARRRAEVAEARRRARTEARAQARQEAAERRAVERAARERAALARQAAVDAERLGMAQAEILQAEGTEEATVAADRLRARATYDAFLRRRREVAERTARGGELLRGGIALVVIAGMRGARLLRDAARSGLVSAWGYLGTPLPASDVDQRAARREFEGEAARREAASVTRGFGVDSRARVAVSAARRVAARLQEAEARVATQERARLAAREEAERKAAERERVRLAAREEAERQAAEARRAAAEARRAAEERLEAQAREAAERARTEMEAAARAEAERAAERARQEEEARKAAALAAEARAAALAQREEAARQAAAEAEAARAAEQARREEAIAARWAPAASAAAKRQEEAEEQRRTAEAWERAQAERERREAAEIERARREDERRLREAGETARVDAARQRREEAEAERARRAGDLRRQRDEARERKIQAARAKAEAERAGREARAAAAAEARRAADAARAERERAVAERRAAERAARAELRARTAAAREARLAALRDRAAAGARAVWERTGPPLAAATIGVVALLVRVGRAGGGRAWTLLTRPLDPSPEALAALERELAVEARERDAALVARSSTADARARVRVALGHRRRAREAAILRRAASAEARRRAREEQTRIIAEAARARREEERRRRDAEESARLTARADEALQLQEAAIHQAEGTAEGDVRAAELRAQARYAALRRRREELVRRLERAAETVAGLVGAGGIALLAGTRGLRDLARAGVTRVWAFVGSPLEADAAAIEAARVDFEEEAGGRERRLGARLVDVDSRARLAVLAARRHAARVEAAVVRELGAQGVEERRRIAALRAMAAVEGEAARRRRAELVFAEAEAVRAARALEERGRREQRQATLARVSERLRRIAAAAGRGGTGLWRALSSPLGGLDQRELEILAGEFRTDAREREELLATGARRRDDRARLGVRGRLRGRMAADRRRRVFLRLSDRAYAVSRGLGQLSQRAGGGSLRAVASTLLFLADGAWWVAASLSRGATRVSTPGDAAQELAVRPAFARVSAGVAAVGRALWAVTRSRVPVVWRSLAGAIDAEDATLTAADMVEFRREAQARDREVLQGGLSADARVRARVRQVRRELESARAAEVARIEATARALRRTPTAARAALRPSDVVRATFARPPLALVPGADLRALSLEDRDLSAASLVGARLDGTSLVGVDLRGTDLQGADLRQADLTGARIAAARLTGALLDGADFTAADLSGADLDDASVVGARFGAALGLTEGLRADLAARGADLSGPPPATGLRFRISRDVARGLRGAGRAARAVAAVPRGLPLPLGPGVDLREQALHDRVLAGLDLRGALLSGAGLVGADLRGASLRGANLRGADLTTALLSGADLTGADLSDALLDEASVDGVTWDDALLDGARLARARGLDDLSRARLAARGADTGVPGERVTPRVARVEATPEHAPGAGLLGGRVLQGVRRLRDGLPSMEPVAVGPNADLRGRALDERDLSGLDLSGANLSGAGLVGADLRGTDLSRADLRGADLTAARLSGASFASALLDDAIFDQAEVDGVRFDDARVDRARFTTALGLPRAVRVDLGRRGADLGEGQDARWARGTSWALAASLFLVVGVYLSARYVQGLDLDSAALEHAAGEASRGGDPSAASSRFEQLAGKAAEVEQKIDFLLEAAGAAQEAGDPARALTLLDQAASLATSTPFVPQVQLRTAQVQAQAGLTDAAISGFRGLLARGDLSPNQQAAGLIGLAMLLPDDGQDEVHTVERSLLAAAATDPQRAALGMALADGWASAGRSDDARGALERALAATDDPAEVVPMRIRLARVVSDQGDADEALAMFQEIMAVPGGKGDEARLGAAEMYARRGAYEEATAVLAPLVESDNFDLRARARLAQAGLSERAGDVDGAVGALREVLATVGLEPRISEEARLALARILVKTDPDAARELVGDSQELKDQVRLGQARVMREEGKRQDARALWVAVADDPLASDAARMEADLSLAELEVEDNDYDAALQRYEGLMGRAVLLVDRQRIQLGAANALVRAGRLQDAEARYLAMLGGAGAGDLADQCRLGLARAAELRGQSERATELYQEVGESQGPWAMEALSALGGMRERLGDFTGAAASYRLAQARPAGEASRRNQIGILLARALEEAGDPAAADEYARLLDAPDPAVRVAARLAVGASVVGSDPERARTLFDEALQEAPVGEERAAARAGWMRATVALGDIDAGLERIRAWLETEADDALRGELALETVKALRAEGRYDEAVAIGERYASEGGFELGMERAGVLREMGRAESAASLLASLSPTGAGDEAWRTEAQADALLAAGQFSEADKLLARLGSVPGAEAAAGFMRARVARERGDYSAALDLLGATDDPRAPIERATVLEALGRWDDAELVWRRLSLAADLETRTAGVLGLARAALSREAPADALRELEALTVVDPGYALTHAQVKGEALLGAAKVEEARTVYASLTDDAESRTVGALGLAECDLAADDAAGALRRFQAAFEATADPWYKARALGGVVRASAEAGDREGAARALARLRDEFPEATEVIDEVRVLGGG